MKTELNREEFREQIRDAFDKTNPDAYSKNAIFSEIEDRYEDSTGKSTVMQSMFRIRKVCIASLAILLIAALSGGTYSAVSMFKVNSSNFNDGQGQSAGSNSAGSNKDNLNESSDSSRDNREDDKDQSSDINQDKGSESKDDSNKAVGKFSYQEAIVKCFRENCALECYYYDDLITREMVDGRLADAIEAAIFIPETKIAGQYEFTYLGMVAGAGISDRVFDKKEIHAFAIIAQRYIDNEEEYDSYTDTSGCIIAGVGPNYRFIYDDVTYHIFDITDAPILSKDNIVQIEAYCYGGTYNDDGMYFNELSESCYFDIDVTDVFGKETLSEAKKRSKTKNKLLLKYNEQVKMFEIFRNWPNEVSDIYFDNWNNFIGLFKSRKHMKKEYEKYESYINEACDSYRTYDNITDNLEEFQERYPETTLGAGGKLVYNIDYKAFAKAYLPDGESRDNELEKYEKKYYYSFRELDIRPQNGMSDTNIYSVTITVDNATLCRVRQATGQEEREYEKSGYLGSMINNPGVGGGDYSVYLDYGDSITIPYESLDSMDEYGIYIQRPVCDYKQYKDAIDLVYDEKFWQVDYLKDNVKIHVSVNSYEGTDEQVLVFGNNYYYDQDTVGKIGYTVCGWE